jgi:hypothetical protein
MAVFLSTKRNLQIRAVDKTQLLDIKADSSTIITKLQR